MRGQNTPPEKVEQVVATAIRTNNKSETGRVLGMPRETVRDIVARMTEPEVAELRRLANNEYVLKTWENILTIETALARKLANNPNIDRLALTEITRSLKDLKQTVENVINNTQVNVQINQYTGTPEQNALILEQEVLDINEELENGKLVIENNKIVKIS